MAIKTEREFYKSEYISIERAIHNSTIDNDDNDLQFLFDMPIFPEITPG